MVFPDWDADHPIWEMFQLKMHTGRAACRVETT